MSTTTHSEQHNLIEPYPGEETPKNPAYSYTKTYDWIKFLPLTAPARTLYELLRSYITDNDNPETSLYTCMISDEELREVFSMGWDSGRTKDGLVSMRSLYRWRRELIDTDFIRVRNRTEETWSSHGGRSRVIGRRYMVRRFPPPGMVVPFHSPWEALRSVRSRRRAEQGDTGLPLTPEGLVDGGFLPPGAACLSLESNMVTPQSKNTPADLGLGVPKKNLSKESSSSSSARGRQAGGRGAGVTPDEDEEMIMTTPAQENTVHVKDKVRETPVAETINGTKTMEFTHEHVNRMEEMARNLPGRPGKSDIQEMVPHLCAALDAGWAPSALRKYLISRCDLSKVAFPGRVYLKNAADLGEPTESEQQGAGIELCGTCDENGRTDVPGAGSSDPAGNPRVCLHGKADPWADEEYRSRVLAERQAAEEADRKAFEALKQQVEGKKALEESARAQQAAERAREAAERKRAAQEFLETAEPFSDPDAQRVRTELLTAEDPVDLEDLPGVLGIALDTLDEGVPLEDICAVISGTSREMWQDRLLDMSPVMS